MQRGVIFETVVVLLLIALLVILYVAVTGSGPKTAGWSIPDIIGAPPMDPFTLSFTYGNLFAGDNGTLYAVDGRHINAIDGNGSLLWSLEIPDRYTLTSYGNGSGMRGMTSGQRQRIYKEEVKNDVVDSSGQPWNAYNAVVKDGNLYIILKHENPVILEGVLLSVSSNGSIRWAIPFSGSWTSAYHYQYGLGSPDGVILHGDLLYVYSNLRGGVSIIGLNGTILDYIDEMTGQPGSFSGKPAIGDDGTLYVRKGPTMLVTDTPGYIVPSIRAHRADGTLIWSHSFDEFGINDSRMPLPIDQPYLRNGNLYVWSDDGVVALDVNGSLKFRYRLPEGSFIGCSFDRNDTLYLSYVVFTDIPYYVNATGIVMLRPDGTVIKSLRSNDSRYAILGVKDVPDGILYRTALVRPFGNGSEVLSDFGMYLNAYTYTTYFDGLVLQYLKDNSGQWNYPRRLRDLDAFNITACDLSTGAELWSYRLPMDKHVDVLNPDNAGKVTFSKTSIDDVNYVLPNEWYASNGLPPGSIGVRSFSWAYPMVVNGTLYVSMWTYNYEYPPFYYRARCVYSGGIFAFDLNGTPKWSTSTDSRIVSLQAVNGTIYYGTGGGSVSIAGAGELAGVLTATVSAIYLFLRFIVAGTVARAKSRLDSNDNRNQVARFIRDNPGATSPEIARDLGLNRGTVRYHLMILGLNHRIVAYRADEKFVRYFANSGTYSPGDQLVIALMRRDPLRKIMATLQERSGLSNLELARALDAPESSTMRNVKELVEKGIVVKNLLPDGKIAYSLDGEYRARTVRAAELLGRYRDLPGNESE